MLRLDDLVTTAQWNVKDIPDSSASKFEDNICFSIRRGSVFLVKCYELYLPTHNCCTSSKNS